MTDKKDLLNIANTIGIGIPSAKQSVVHSTFNLSKEAHYAISKIKELQHEKIAELFNGFLQLSVACHDFKIPITFDSDKKNDAKIKKTYVVYKSTLKKIDVIAKEYKVSRDLLIEKMSQAFLATVESELFKQREEYRDIYDEILIPLETRIHGVEKELANKLGKDDPIVMRFSVVAIVMEKLISDIKDNLEHGEPIDPDAF